MQYFNVSLKSLASLLPGCPLPLSHCISINLELKSAKQLCDYQKCLKSMSMKMYFLWQCATMKLFLMKRQKLYLLCYLPGFAVTIAAPPQLYNG